MSTDEATLLVDTIDQAIEGHRDAKDAMISDPSIETVEDFAELMHEADDRIDMLEGIKKKVPKRW